MPLPGDQHRDTSATVNPFADTKPLISEYTASEIATLQSRLEKQLGPEYISTRPGAGGGKVHYLAAEKVINLANEVFGFNGWSSSIQNVQIDFVDEHPQNGKISLGLSTIVRVSLKDGTYHEDIGYGHIENCKGKAAAFEKAKKEAATDALKRALRNFGNVLGNCLYDKDYLSKITKVKCAPSRWDSGNLHRHPDFKPIKRESIAEAESANDNAVAARRHESLQSGMSFGSAEFEDDFGAGGLDDVDFSHPDEVVGIDDSTATVAPETPAQRAINGPQRQPLPRVASMPQLRPGNVQSPAPMQGMSAPQRPQGVQRPQGGVAQIPGGNHGGSGGMMPPPAQNGLQNGPQQALQSGHQQQQQGQQNGQQQQQGQQQHGQPPRQQNGQQLQGQQQNQRIQPQQPQAQQGSNGMQHGGPNGMQKPQQPYQHQTRQPQQQQQPQGHPHQQPQGQPHQPLAQAQQPNQPQHHQQPNGSGGNRSNPSSATTIADSPSNLGGNKTLSNQYQNQHTNPGAHQQQQQQHTTNPLPPPPLAAPNQHPDLPLPRDPPPGAPDGFITARSTAGLEGMAKIAALENPVPFNPHADSPSIRRTHGVNPGKSAAVMRTAISAAQGGPITVPPANGGGNGGIVTPGRQVRNFVEPAADTNRRIGAPGGMGGRGSGAFRAPTSVVGVKRPPLADVSNAHLNQVDGAGDAKKTKTESSDTTLPGGAGEGGGGTTAAPAAAP
ncbi:DNA repair protein rad52 [Elasticomyces elasticus]|nr:DNA repair protein rad52 [Elasticomyces elasticus]